MEKKNIFDETKINAEKEYKAPTVKVFDIKIESALLQASGTVDPWEEG